MKRESFHNRFITAMREAGITQRELCKRTGMSAARISQYYNGIYEPKQDGVYSIARALDVSPVWLMGYDVPRDSAVTGTIEVRQTVKPKVVAVPDYSAHEKQIISALRTKPEMLAIVDKLLDISTIVTAPESAKAKIVETADTKPFKIKYRIRKKVKHTN